MIGIFQFPNLAMKNSHLINNNDMAGCYSCCKKFDSCLIKEFTDSGKTCICPFCKNDCVIFEITGFIVNEEILQKGHKFWLEK